MEPVSLKEPTRPRKRPKAKVLMIAIALAVGLVFAGHAMRPGSNSLPAGTSAFVKGKGVAYHSADASYSVEFPKAPAQSRDSAQLGAYAVSINSATASTDDYELATSSIAMPDAPTGALATELLTDALAAGVTQVGGTESQPVSQTRGAFPALEESFKGPDGFQAKALVMIDGKWLFELFAHARTGTDGLFDALDKSFAPVSS